MLSQQDGGIGGQRRPVGPTQANTISATSQPSGS